MNTAVRRLKDMYYPGRSSDGTAAFYDWIRSEIEASYVVLNIGAGPGSDRKVKSLKGEVRRVMGIDPDPAIMSNPDLDRATVSDCKTLPFPDKSFDMVWADFVMEHVEHPLELLREVARVLKPGASFFFRTPNKWHYVTIIAKVTPHWFHGLIANRARGLSPEAHEPYPTYYLFNSRADITRVGRAIGFREIRLRFIETEPSYLCFNRGTFLLGVLYERFVNRYQVCASLRSNVFGQLIS